MLYTAIMFLGVNEMGPVNPDEMIACLVILNLSAFFNALIFSDLVILVVVLFQQDQEDEQVIADMHDLMNYIGMPREDVQQIEMFILTNRHNMRVQDLFGFLMIVVPSQKRKILQQYYFKNVLEKSAILKEISRALLNHPKIPKHEQVDQFCNVPTHQNKVNCLSCCNAQIDPSLFDKSRYKFLLFLDRLTENFDVCFAMPDEDITRQGTYSGKSMFFILKGHCNVYLKNDNGGLRERMLIESQYFGEISMFYNCERTATVRSHSYNMFAQIHKIFFDQFNTVYPKMRNIMKELIWSY